MPHLFFRLILPISLFSKNGLTTGFLRFESYPVNPFGRSLFMQRAPKRYKLFGSNPSIPYFFGVLCKAKKRKKYTSIFALKTEKTGSGTAALLL